jgi:hypothetical protein
MPRVFIDGGSTAYGLWAGPEGGWADRIKPAHMPAKSDQYGNRPLWKVYNLADIENLELERVKARNGWLRHQ